MKNGTLFTCLGVLALVQSLAFSGQSDWIPVFNDKPVPQDRAERVEAALPSEAIVPANGDRKILVYSATAGYRHGSIPTGKLALTRMGAATGAYSTVISDDPANFEPDVLKTFDAVVLLNTTQDFFMPNKKRERENFSADEWAWLEARHDRLVDNLIDYVEAGGGLMGIHAATDSCYRHKEYGETIGAYFDGHPWNANNNVTIVVEDCEHATIKPVFDGMTDFSLVEEIYQFRPEPYTREKLRILLHLDLERSDVVKNLRREDNDYPVAWVQSVGEGRVFYTSIGHNHHIYEDPLMLKHYLAGIQFAIGDLQADTTPSAHVER